MKKILEVKKEIGTLSKNSKNPFFKSQYLDLNDLLNAVEPILQKNGLILLQPIIGNSVHSVIYDSESGNEVCGSSIDIPANISDPQKLGSCITYFRRYTLKSLLAIAEKDDDGNEASKPTPINIDRLNTRLNACKSLEDLKKVYDDFSAEEKKATLKLKDELKTKLK